MVAVAREVRIRASAERVWRALVEPAQRAQWGLTFIEEPLPSGAAIGLGSRIRGTRRASTTGSRYELEVVEFAPPRRLVMRLSRNGRPQGRVAFDVQSEPADVVVVRDEIRIELQGMQKLLAPVVTAGLERDLVAELASLKNHVEAQKDA